MGVNKKAVNKNIPIRRKDFKKWKLTSKER
jgi:hypothetical protein